MKKKRPDPRCMKTRAEIKGWMELSCVKSTLELARLTGINENTLGMRMNNSHPENIANMTLGELWAIEDALKGNGVRV